MKAVDVNSLFRRAEQAFAAGRLDAARADLVEVRRLSGPDHPAVLHLFALVEKRRGDAGASRVLFQAALRLAPTDAQINSNYANLLSELGEVDAALRRYDKALAAQPEFRDARYNRALLLRKMGRPIEALAELDRLAAGAPDARVHSERGAILRTLGRLTDAARAYDDALEKDPGRLTALHGRARVAMERGETEASAFYVRALQRRPGDLELVLGLTEALEAEGDAEGLRLLAATVERHPDWLEGHEVLARMRSEAGEGDRYADHYETSIARRPRDRGLHLSHWRTLVRGQKYTEALHALRKARHVVGDDSDTRLMEAVFASEAGDPHAALSLLASDGLAADHPGFASARGRIALRAGDVRQAADLFEAAVRTDPASVNDWAHLDLCWRALGDPRHQWLSGQPGLYAARDVGLSPAELAELAGRLRDLHKTRAHPIGQSLRGGTQSRGRLFDRREPSIVRLHDAIAAAVDAHVRALPPRDEGHPLLRHRDAELAIGGSWTVRLTSQGFHVNHIHPEGVLSSACYVSLPATIGGDDTRDGWLELGRPPTELGLALEPLAAIEPRPGRLALFPSYLFHGTRPFRDGERLTVAFDVVAR